MIRKIVALLTTGMFAVTSVVQAELISTGDVAAAFALEKPVDVRSVNVPSELGSVQSFYQAKNANQTVIMIQDAHAVPDAQRSIQRLIDYFQQEYGVGLVGVEGAEGELEPQIFKSYPEQEELKTVFEDYFERGELTGATAAAIFNERNAGYWGVEDWALYVEGLEHYQEGIRTNAKLAEMAEGLAGDLERRKRETYSEVLLKVDQTVRSFQQDHNLLIQLLEFLSQVQRPAADSALATILDQDMEHVKKIEGAALLEELEQYIISVKESLFRDDKERKLDQESVALERLRRLIVFELSRKDWERIKRASVGGINERLLEHHLAFYENAEERDGVFFKNVTRLMKKKLGADSSQTAILILGGFHTQALTDRFKENDISYVVLAPHIDAVPENASYHDQMVGETSWRDYYRVEKGVINLHDAFVRATRDKLLKTSRASPRFVKEWRDQIIRDLADSNQLSKVNQTVSFLDEVWRGETYKAGWNKKLERVDQFLKGLRGLVKTSQLTEQNVMKLFQPASMTPAPTANAIVRSSLPAHLLTSAAEPVPTNIHVIADDTTVEQLSDAFRPEVRNIEIASDQDKWKRTSVLAQQPSEQSARAEPHYTLVDLSKAARELIGLGAIYLYSGVFSYEESAHLTDKEKALESTLHFARHAIAKPLEEFAVGFRQKNDLRVLGWGPGTGMDAMTAIKQLLVVHEIPKITMDLIDIEQAPVDNTAVNIGRQLKALGIQEKRTTGLDWIEFKYQDRGVVRVLHVREGHEIEDLKKMYERRRGLTFAPYHYSFFNVPVVSKAEENQPFVPGRRGYWMPERFFRNIVSGLSNIIDDDGVALFGITDSDSQLLDQSGLHYTRIADSTGSLSSRGIYALTHSFRPEVRSLSEKDKLWNLMSSESHRSDLTKTRERYARLLATDPEVIELSAEVGWDEIELRRRLEVIQQEAKQDEHIHLEGAISSPGIRLIARHIDTLMSDDGRRKFWELMTYHPNGDGAQIQRFSHITSEDDMRAAILDLAAEDPDFQNLSRYTEHNGSEPALEGFSPWRTYLYQSYSMGAVLLDPRVIPDRILEEVAYLTVADVALNAVGDGVDALHLRVKADRINDTVSFQYLRFLISAARDVEERIRKDGQKIEIRFVLSFSRRVDARVSSVTGQTPSPDDVETYIRESLISPLHQLTKDEHEWLSGVDIVGDEAVGLDVARRNVPYINYFVQEAKALRNRKGVVSNFVVYAHAGENYTDPEAGLRMMEIYADLGAGDGLKTLIHGAAFALIDQSSPAYGSVASVMRDAAIPLLISLSSNRDTIAFERLIDFPIHDLESRGLHLQASTDDPRASHTTLSIEQLKMDLVQAVQRARPEVRPAYQTMMWKPPLWRRTSLLDQVSGEILSRNDLRDSTTSLDLAGWMRMSTMAALEVGTLAKSLSWEISTAFSFWQRENMSRSFVPEGNRVAVWPSDLIKLSTATDTFSSNMNFTGQNLFGLVEDSVSPILSDSGRVVERRLDMGLGKIGVGLENFLVARAILEEFQHQIDHNSGGLAINPKTRLAMANLGIYGDVLFSDTVSHTAEIITQANLGQVDPLFLTQPIPERAPYESQLTIPKIRAEVRSDPTSLIDDFVRLSKFAKDITVNPSVAEISWTIGLSKSGSKIAGALDRIFEQHARITEARVATVEELDIGAVVRVRDTHRGEQNQDFVGVVLGTLDADGPYFGLYASSVGHVLLDESATSQAGPVTYEEAWLIEQIRNGSVEIYKVTPRPEVRYNLENPIKINPSASQSSAPAKIAEPRAEVRSENVLVHYAFTQPGSDPEAEDLTGRVLVFRYENLDTSKIYDVSLAAYAGRVYVQSATDAALFGEEDMLGQHRESILTALIDTPAAVQELRRYEKAWAPFIDRLPSELKRKVNETPIVKLTAEQNKSRLIAIAALIWQGLNNHERDELRTYGPVGDLLEETTEKIELLMNQGAGADPLTVQEGAQLYEIINRNLDRMDELTYQTHGLSSESIREIRVEFKTLQSIRAIQAEFLVEGAAPISASLTSLGAFWVQSETMRRMADATDPIFRKFAEALSQDEQVRPLILKEMLRNADKWKKIKVFLPDNWQKAIERAEVRNAFGVKKTIAADSLSGDWHYRVDSAAQVDTEQSLADSENVVKIEKRGGRGSRTHSPKKEDSRYQLEPPTDQAVAPSANTAHSTQPKGIRGVTKGHLYYDEYESMNDARSQPVRHTRADVRVAAMSNDTVVDLLVSPKSEKVRSEVRQEAAAFVVSEVQTSGIEAYTTALWQAATFSTQHEYAEFAIQQMLHTFRAAFPQGAVAVAVDGPRQQRTIEEMFRRMKHPEQFLALLSKNTQVEDAHGITTQRIGLLSRAKAQVYSVNGAQTQDANFVPAVQIGDETEEVSKNPDVLPVAAAASQSEIVSRAFGPFASRVEATSRFLVAAATARTLEDVKDLRDPAKRLKVASALLRQQIPDENGHFVSLLRFDGKSLLVNQTIIALSAERFVQESFSTAA